MYDANDFTMSFICKNIYVFKLSFFVKIAPIVQRLGEKNCRNCAHRATSKLPPYDDTSICMSKL